MKQLLQRLKNASPDEILYKILPFYFMELVKSYFRVEVVGGHNIPKSGRAIIAANHSGVSGLDGMILHHEVRQVSGRLGRVLTHHLWFLNPATAVPAVRLGFIEATMQNGIKVLNNDQLVIIFPEGERGNFKPSVYAYQLQEFKRGFIRMALETQAPIIPTLVIGAEESHFNLKKLKLGKFVKGLSLPLPINLIPLPSKWKIVFLEPVHLPYGPDALDDAELVHELAEDFQEKMQLQLNQELSQRRGVFF